MENGPFTLDPAVNWSWPPMDRNVKPWSVMGLGSVMWNCKFEFAGLVRTRAWKFWAMMASVLLLWSNRLKGFGDVVTGDVRRSWPESWTADVFPMSSTKMFWIWGAPLMPVIVNSPLRNVDCWMPLSGETVNSTE